MYRLLGDQLWFFKKPSDSGVLIANGVPSSIKDPDHALKWADDMGRNSYEELIDLADEYRKQADETSNSDLRKSFLELEREARERAEYES